MNQYARLKVFSSVYGVAYMALFLYSELYKVALFRYYPVLGRFDREAIPLETAGPPILWYSWLLRCRRHQPCTGGNRPAKLGGTAGTNVGLWHPGSSAPRHHRVRAPVVLLTSSW